DFVSLMMNAVYFQGNWAFPFDEKLTEEEDFERANGKTVQVPMMSLPNKELYYTKNDDYETVRLPYGEDEEMSMYLFLPGENSDVDDIFKDLSKNNIDDIKRELEQQEGTVKLPKFSLEEEIELNDLLKSLGMENAFDKEKADFSNMVEEEDQLWI